VLTEEAQDTTAKLLAEITDLHTRMVDKGRALMWMWRQNALRLQGDAAFPGAPDARAILVFPVDQSALWHVASASPTEARWSKAFARLKQDAAAEVPR